MDKLKYRKNCSLFYGFLKIGRGGIYIGDNTVLCGNVSGQQILSDIRHSRSLQISFKPRPVDMGVMAFLYHYIKGGMVGAEIDAGCGFYSIFLTSLVGPNGKIYSFEPIPECYDLIVRNTQMNDVHNVVPIKKMVLDGLKNVKQKYFDVNYEFSFSPPEGYLKKESIAEATTLDEYLKVAEETLLDFLIINNEAELPLIWKGMSDTLDGSLDIKIVCKFNQHSLKLHGHDPEAFLNQVTERKFKIYLVPTLEQVSKEKLLCTSVERTVVLSRNEL
ncbi:MAG: hypothetical protein H0U49_08670 [Parachlamydiaceae bacterium]|nr:hypothetical protein [Parachlamydiaceae bacterium]